MIISDNEAFSCLIIKSFDNQTFDLTLIISDNQGEVIVSPSPSPPSVCEASVLVQDSRCRSEHIRLFTSYSLYLPFSTIINKQVLRFSKVTDFPRHRHLCQNPQSREGKFCTEMPKESNSIPMVPQPSTPLTVGGKSRTHVMS